MKGYLLMNPTEITEKVTTKQGKSFDSTNWVGQTPKGFEKKVPANYVLKIVKQEDSYSKVFLKDLRADELAKKSSYVQDLYKYASKLEEEPPALSDPNLYTVDQNVFDSIEVDSAIKQDQQEAKEQAQSMKVSYQGVGKMMPIVDDIPTAVFDSGVVHELEKKVELQSNIIKDFYTNMQRLEELIFNNLSNIAILEKKLSEQDEVIRDLAFQKNTLNLGQDTMDFLWKVVERLYTFRSCEDKKEDV